jgi:hypothetical protein
MFAVYFCNTQGLRMTRRNCYNIKDIKHTLLPR